jgi:glycine/D-amino acid oxidase-like deaminating enzyme
VAEAADIVIAGGGPVGLALACALEQSGFRATVVSASTTASDRPIALSHASRMLLERLARGATRRNVRRFMSQRGGLDTLIDHGDYKLPRWDTSSRIRTFCPRSVLRSEGRRQRNRHRMESDSGRRGVPGAGSRPAFDNSKPVAGDRRRIAGNGQISRRPSAGAGPTIQQTTVSPRWPR